MPFSFVHASDLRLGAPPIAVADLPDELRSRVVNARYTAARRVFDLALNERVDAVVLAGGVIAPSAGPPAMRFFTDQCERLEAAGVDVIWAEIESDRNWTEFVPLPNNVVLTGPRVGQVHEVLRGAAPAAEVMAVSAQPRRLPVCPDMIRIGILPGAAADTMPEFPDIDYLALGGRSIPGAIPSPCGLAQFPGTTQGGGPAEQGPRGCLLVQAAANGPISSRFIPTAGVEWRDERISVDRGADWDALRIELMDRLNAISRTATAQAVLVRWIASGHGIVWQQLLREDANAQLLQELRSESCGATHPVWSLFIEAAPDGREQAPLDDGVRDVSTIHRRVPMADWALGGVDQSHAVIRAPHVERCSVELRRQAPVSPGPGHVTNYVEELS